MQTRRITASRTILSPADRVYAILADYREGHPRILPRPPFGALEVESGGLGAGTVVRCTIRMLGRTNTFRASISEPEPGRVLKETDLSGKVETTFTIDPRDDGRGCEVTIATDLRTRGGLVGNIEHALAAWYLRPLYIRELENLAQYAQGRPDETAVRRAAP